MYGPEAAEMKMKILKFLIAVTEGGYYRVKNNIFKTKEGTVCKVYLFGPLFGPFFVCVAISTIYWQPHLNVIASTLI